MRRSSEPQERAQFTVAELLARYGEPTLTTGRRHRRAAEDTGTFAPAAEAPNVPVNRADRGEPTMRSEPTQPSLPRRQWAPAVSSSSVTGRAPLTRTALPDGGVTDQLPRFDPLPMNPAPWSSHRPISAQPISAQPAAAQPPAGLGSVTRGLPEQNGNVTADPESTHAESSSPLWEWAAMVSQIGIGVVGGAALWLVCEWLWQRIPVVALVVALALITGLVWIVRRVRRAEDLQTTVIAVLVGLFVTVSPAALLLVGR
jgi:hypothetical protein